MIHKDYFTDILLAFAGKYIKWLVPENEIDKVKNQILDDATRRPEILKKLVSLANSLGNDEGKIIDSVFITPQLPSKNERR